MPDRSSEGHPRSSRAGSALLMMVVFVCGFALMGLEMLGARLLNPYFGSSIYVWGSVISIFLLALSVGYWVGGWLSTWRADARVLGLAILLAAAGFALVPEITKPVNESVFNLELDDRWGALLSASVLFLLPSILLGVVSPFAVRLATRDVASAGASAGLLYAVSTLGSFLGCIATSFYFVLWMSVPWILRILAAMLVAVAVVCWVMPRREERRI
jgi:predicted membrane-bound spermidine synthase